MYRIFYLMRIEYLLGLLWYRGMVFFDSNRFGHLSNKSGGYTSIGGVGKRDISLVCEVGLEIGYHVG